MPVGSRNNMISIVFEKDGLYHFTYEIQDKEIFNIKVKENVQATCMLELKGSAFEIEKQITLYSNSSLHILYKNECEQYQSKEKIDIYDHAHMVAGYFEIDKNQSCIKAEYQLKGVNAKAEIITTSLARADKQLDIACVHQFANTESNIENYAINDKNGKLYFIASGKIEKGAKGSKSHQSTRILTLAEGNREKVNVTPLLLIDENDVEASHACGIGEMNEDHLYYLQTRGLSKRAALGLLTLSYFLPILRVVEDEKTLKTEIEEEIQRKVGL